MAMDPDGLNQVGNCTKYFAADPISKRYKYCVFRGAFET